MAYEPYLPAWGIVQIETMRPATGIVILCEKTLAHGGNCKTTCLHFTTRVGFWDKYVTFLAHFPCFQKIKVGLWITSLSVCLCVCESPLLTFECLNQSLWNLVCI
jgi:hypothetical protein